jgi:hypothetical protein
MIGRSGPGALAVLFTPRAIRELLETVTWWRKIRLVAPRLLDDEIAINNGFTLTGLACNLRSSAPPPSRCAAADQVVLEHGRQLRRGDAAARTAIADLCAGRKPVNVAVAQISPRTRPFPCDPA